MQKILLPPFSRFGPLSFKTSTSAVAPWSTNKQKIWVSELSPVFIEFDAVFS